MTECSLVDRYQRYGDICFRYLHGKRLYPEEASSKISLKHWYIETSCKVRLVNSKMIPVQIRAEELELKYL
jgi:hypothetical protein